MTSDFERVDAALASSIIGRTVIFLGDATQSAWRSSATGAAIRSIDAAWRNLPAPAAVRTVAIAIMIAALLQPLLISVMPLTVVPAIPLPAFALVAVFAGLAASQADAIVRAWPASRLARRHRR